MTEPPAGFPLGESYAFDGERYWPVVMFWCEAHKAFANLSCAGPDCRGRVRFEPEGPTVTLAEARAGYAREPEGKAR